MFKTESGQSSSETWIRSMALLTLVLQNSALILTMRYARSLPKQNRHYQPFSVVSAVFLAEWIKLFVSLFFYCLQRPTANPLENKQFHYNALKTWKKPSPFALMLKDVETLVQELRNGLGYLLPPALMYTVQNMLQYIAITYLDAATFQVTSQLKILTTACCAVLFLHARLQPVKWLSLFLLTAGVALVQWPVDAGSQKSHESKVRVMGLALPASWVGFAAILGATSLSGLAGVYFEKVLKDQKRSPSLWQKNAQLSLLGIVFSALTGFASSSPDGWHQRFWLVGFEHPVTWCAVLLNALGGLLVAMVIKYADNILKGFATTLAIILSSVVSMYLFQWQGHFKFYVGTLLVVVAMLLYATADTIHQPWSFFYLNRNKTKQRKPDHLTANALMSKMQSMSSINIYTEE